MMSSLITCPILLPVSTTNSLRWSMRLDSTATKKHEETNKGAMGDGMPSILMRAPEQTTKGLLVRTQDDFDGLYWPLLSHGIPWYPHRAPLGPWGPWGTSIGSVISIAPEPVDLLFDMLRSSSQQTGPLPASSALKKYGTWHISGAFSHSSNMLSQE